MSSAITGGSFQSESSTPEIRGFQLGNGGLGDLADSVNRFRGDVNLPVTLVDLPIQRGPGIVVKAMYLSNVHPAVTSWNLSSPTGVLGLGWSLTLEQIVVVNQSTGTNFDDQFFLVTGGNVVPLLHYGEEDGAIIYHCDAYPLWKISYLEDLEKWTIIKEDGSRDIYGDKDSGRNTLQFGVRWGNWIGSSILETGDIDSYVSVWNLSERRSAWGSGNLYTYENDNVPVTSTRSYTRASYISEILDPMGRKVNFAYGEKYPEEYLPQHILPGGERYYAYQERYETKFLKSINVADPGGNEYYTLQFAYYPDLYNYYQQVHPDSDNPYAVYFGKRLLKSITQQRDGKTTLPSLLFEYETDLSSSNPGALCAVTYPEGGTISYTYDKNTWNTVDDNDGTTDIFARNITVPNPFTSLGTPRVWFGSDYVVILWYTTSKSYFQLQVFSWGGRWSEPWVDETILSPPRLEDLEQIRTITGDDFFTIYINTENTAPTKVYVAHKVKNQFGQWKLETLEVSRTGTLVPEETTLAAGNDFFILHVGGANIINQYQYNRLQEKWGEPQTFSGSSSQIAAAAGNNFYLVGYHQSGSLNETRIHYRDRDFQWKHHKLIFSSPAFEWESFYANRFWALGSSFAVGNYLPTGENTPTLFIIMWDESFEVAKQFTGKEAEFIGSIVLGSTITNGKFLYRYNGEEWLMTQFFPQGKTDKYAYWNDLAILSEIEGSGANNITAAYSPYGDNGRGQWSLENFSSKMEVEHRDALDAETGKLDVFPPSIRSQFVTIENGVYYLDPKSQLLSIGELSNRSDKESLVNRGPFYIAYDDLEQEKTIVLLLKNNEINSSKEFPGERISPGDVEGSGTMLAGSDAFVTFPEDQSFNTPKEIYLHRVLNASLEDRQEDIVVAAASSNDGFRVLSFSFDYDTDTAVFDSSGKVVQYPRVAVFQEDGQGSLIGGKTVYYYHNGLPNPDEPADSPFNKYFSLFSGFLFKTSVYDQEGTLVSESQSQWQGLELNAGSDSGVGVLLPTAVPVKKKEVSVESGLSTALQSIGKDEGTGNGQITRMVEMDYDDNTGFLLGQTASKYNSAGEKETRRELLVYAWSVPAYSGLLEERLLTEVAQTTQENTSKSVYIGSSVKTFRLFSAVVNGVDTRVWEEYQSFQWQGPKTKKPVFDFTIGANPEGWLKTSEVLARHPKTGVVTAASDVSGLVQSLLFDQTGYLNTARFLNAKVWNQPDDPGSSPKEAGYYGFESYEEVQGWQTETGGTIDDLIYTEDSHTGNACLKLEGGGSTPVVQNEFQVPAAGGYYFSCWIKTQKDFPAPGQEAGWDFMFNGSSVGELSIRDTQGEWVYLFKYIEISDAGGGDFPAPVTCRLSNRVDSYYILVDDISFFPVTGNFSGEVYQLSNGLRTAALGMNGETVRYLYDTTDRMISSVGPNESPAGMIAYFYARADNQEPDWQVSPNSFLEISPTAPGVFEDFRDGQWQDAWSSPDPSQWQVEEQKLTHKTTASGEVSLRDWESETGDGVRLTIGVRDNTTVNREFGVKMGTRLTVRWQPRGQWELLDNGQVLDSYPAASPDLPLDFLLLIGPLGVIVFLDGRQALGAVFTGSITGALSLYSQQENLDFSDILVFRNPITNMHYFNGAAQEVQSQSLADDGVVVSGKYYDLLGHPVINTKAMTYNGQMLGFQKDFITGFDWGSGVMTGDLASFYNGSDGHSNDQGYPYARQLYSNSPLARLEASGVPGKELAISPDSNHFTNYQYAVNSSDTFPGNLPAGEYFVEITLGPDGNTVQKIRDKDNVLIGVLVISADGTESETKISHEYNDIGQLTLTKPPNYFHPPAGSAAADWVVRRTNDYLGQVIESTAPDIGTTKFIYDKAGRVRFILTQQGQGSGQGGTDRIIYNKYDVLGRLTEAGYWDQTWNRETLQTEADNPEIPQSPTYQHIKYSYDKENDQPYALGRVSLIETSQGEGKPPVREIFQYDIYGNVTEKSTATGSADSDKQIVSYTYDTVSKVLSVTYPHLPSQTQDVKKVCYGYNSLGQVQDVGKPGTGNESAYATLTFTPAGSIASETFNPSGSQPIQRTYQYNSPGWNTRIEDPFFLEEISYYEQPGFRKSFYNGLISRLQDQFQGEAASRTQYPDIQWLFDYSAAQRLLTAQNTEIPQYSIGTGDQPVSYDGNGNILSLVEGETNPQTQCWNYYAGKDQVKNSTCGDRKTDDYTYDGNGNTITTPETEHRELGYNLVTGLTETVSSEEEKTVSFTYNSGIQRISLVQEDKFGNVLAERRYLLGVDDFPLIELWKEGQAESQRFNYIRMPYGILAIEYGDATYYLLTDHEGSTRVAVDETGSVIATFSYLPYGADMGEPGGIDPGLITYRYTGQEWDRGTGLYDFKARMYSPGLRRFLSVDPQAQFFSPYVFVGNDPIEGVDPDGEFAFLIAALIIGAVVGAAAGAVTAATNGADSAGEWIGYILGGAAIGAAAGLVSAGIGAAVGAGATAIVSGAGLTGASATAVTATGAIVGGTLAGAAGGAIQGASMAALSNTISGTNLDIGKEALFGAAAGAVGGAVSSSLGQLGKGLSGVARAGRLGSFARGTGSFLVKGGAAGFGGASAGMTNASLRGGGAAQILTAGVTGAVVGGLTGFAAGKFNSKLNSLQGRQPNPEENPLLEPRRNFFERYSQNFIENNATVRRSLWEGTTVQGPPFILVNTVNPFIKRFFY